MAFLFNHKYKILGGAVALSLLMFQNCAPQNPSNATNATSLESGEACGSQAVSNCTMPEVLSGAQQDGSCAGAATGTSSGACIYICESGAFIEIMNTCTAPPASKDSNDGTLNP